MSEEQEESHLARNTNVSHANANDQGPFSQQRKRQNQVGIQQRNQQNIQRKSTEKTIKSSCEDAHVTDQVQSSFLELIKDMRIMQAQMAEVLQHLSGIPRCPTPVPQQALPVTSLPVPTQVMQVPPYLMVPQAHNPLFQNRM